MMTTTLRKKMTARRQARAARQTALRELASYRTPSEVNDLLAVLDQQESPDADTIRGILLNQADRASVGMAS